MEIHLRNYTDTDKKVSLTVYMNVAGETRFMVGNGTTEEEAKIYTTGWRAKEGPFKMTVDRSRPILCFYKEKNSEVTISFININEKFNVKSEGGTITECPFTI